MIHLLEQQEKQFPHADGLSEEDCPKLAEADDAPYALYAAPRWNDTNKMVENHYEVFNKETGVIESRNRTNFVTAVSILEAIVNVWKEYKVAGSAEAMGNPEEDDGQEYSFH